MGDTAGGATPPAGGSDDKEGNHGAAGVGETNKEAGASEKAEGDKNAAMGVENDDGKADGKAGNGASAGTTPGGRRQLSKEEEELGVLEKVGRVLGILG